MDKVSVNHPPTPPESVPELAGSQHEYEYVSLTTTSAGEGALHDLKPYNQYLPPQKRSALALKEFELQMAEKELRLKNLDKEMQKFTAPRMRKYTLPFALDDTQLAMATSRFPRTIFKCGMDSGHDHPMAHLETMIASDRACHMIPAGTTVYDIYGSPKRVAAMNAQQVRSNNPKTFIAYVKLATEKDYIRKLDWANHPHVLGTDLAKDFFPSYAGPGEIGKTGGLVKPGPGCAYLMVHTLYYVSDEEIMTLLTYQDSRIVAVVHRHYGDSGSMFCGETTFAKVGSTVEQVNVATGERYVHKDLSYLFTSRTKVRRCALGAYVWTLHKVTDETWIVVMTACDMKMDERFSKREKDAGFNTAVHELNEHSEQPSQFPHPALAKLPSAACTVVGGVALVSVRGTDIRDVRLTCAPLLKFLRLHVAGKPRDATRLQDLFALARLHCDDGTEFAGKRNFKCEPADVAGHVMLAFLSDLESEAVLLRSYTAYKAWTTEHKVLLDGAGFVKGSGPESTFNSALRVLATVNSVRKGKDVVGGLLDAVN